MKSTRITKSTESTKTAVINFKVDPKVKARAQRRAKRLGVSLSTVLSGHLYEFARGDAFSIDFPEEKMTPRMERLIEQVQRENEELGTVGPFTPDEFIAHLKEISPHGD